MISCNNKIDYKNYFYNKSLIECGSFSIIYGIFSAIFLGIGTYDKDLFIKDYIKLSFKHKILRFMI